MFALNNMNRIHISNNVLNPLLNLYEHKGKAFYYDNLFKRDQEAFFKKTLEENIECVFKMLDFDVTDARLQSFIKKDLSPKNKTEIRMKNIKSVLIALHEADEFEVLANEFSDLAKMLLKDLDKNQYNMTIIEGEKLLNQRKISKREDLEKLVELMQLMTRKKNIPLTHVISNFYVDFMNLNIFKYDNDLIGLFMLYGLLLHHFSALRYVPFFKHFIQFKEAFKQAEIAASYYWSSGYAQTEFLTQIVLDVLTLCYEDIDKLAHTYTFEVKLNKTDSIENTIYKLPEVFTKKDLRSKHPTVSGATIDRTLARLRDEGKIRPLGKGRSSKWQQLIEKTAHKTMKQLSLFGDEL
jgi:hypothetical protein